MSSSPKVSSERAASILNEVPVEKAFYFYIGTDRPLPVSARSLGEFSDKIKTVESTSLEYHTERQDFEKWVVMLGDDLLAKKLTDVRRSKAQGDALRAKLYNSTKSRVDQLRRASMKIPR